MTQSAILKMFEETKALLKGHFKLSSGLHSAQYLQCALLLQNPKYCEILAKTLAANFKDANIDMVIGPALGGIVLSYEVARSLGCSAIFTERESGVVKLRRGFSIDKENKVLIVEDVVTTGLSTREVIDLVKKTGAHIVGVGALVNRAKEADFNVPFKSLIKMDIPTFKEEECPLCKDKIPLVKPGSRKK